MIRFTVVLAIASLSLPLAATAKEDQPAAGGDPMAGWKPTKVTRAAQDKKEIEAVLKRFDAAAMKGDLDAAVAQVDFPVLMVTDTAKGEAMAETWTREQWVERMKPMYAHPMPDAKVTHKYSVFLVSDSLATVGDEWSMTMGKQKMAARSAMVLVRKDGKWLVKTMMEGGWGDVPAMVGEHGAGGAASTAPSGSDASSGAASGSAPSSDAPAAGAPSTGTAPADAQPQGGAGATGTAK